MPLSNTALFSNRAFRLSMTLDETRWVVELNDAGVRALPALAVAGLEVAAFVALTDSLAR